MEIDEDCKMQPEEVSFAAGGNVCREKDVLFKESRSERMETVAIREVGVRRRIRDLEIKPFACNNCQMM